MDIANLQAEHFGLQTIDLYGVLSPYSIQHCSIKIPRDTQSPHRLKLEYTYQNFL